MNLLIKAVDSMLEHLLNSHDLRGKLLCNLVPFFPGAMRLLSTNRDRSIVNFILTQIFSSTSLTNYLGISGILQISVTSELLPFVEVVDSKLSSLQQEAELNIKNQIENLSIKIDRQEDILKRKETDCLMILLKTENLRLAQKSNILKN